jgi:hypothetical protein
MPGTTEAAIAITWEDSAEEAGKKLAEEIKSKFNGKSPHAVLVFASSRYDYPALLRSLNAGCGPEVLVGCSSAGEFTNHHQKEGAVCAVGIRSERLKFSSGIARNLRGDKAQAAAQMASTFKGLGNHEYRYHTAIVMADALAGYTDDFIQELTLKTGGKYQVVGGGAGDDAKFFQTEVFHGTESFKDAAVALEIISNEPIGIGVQHGWEPASPPMRVTEAEGSRVVSIDAMPAFEAFSEFAASTGQSLNPKDPIPFFLHNVIGLQTTNGYKLRVPLNVHEDGSISCASTVPEGSTIHIMRTTNHSAAKAAIQSAEAALAQMNGSAPKVAIFFDCVATRLRLGVDFGVELDAVSSALKGADFVGCNTYGQIARVDGQFSGFHNCTAVTCVLP